MLLSSPKEAIVEEAVLRRKSGLVCTAFTWLSKLWLQKETTFTVFTPMRFKVILAEVTLQSKYEPYTGQRSCLHGTCRSCFVLSSVFVEIAQKCSKVTEAT